jgi:hypothetical protein
MQNYDLWYLLDFQSFLQLSSGCSGNGQIWKHQGTVKHFGGLAVMQNSDVFHPNVAVGGRIMRNSPCRSGNFPPQSGVDTASFSFMFDWNEESMHQGAEL